MIDALTNNRSRTAPEMRRIFERHGGNLATSGAVAFQFTKQGIITIKSDAVDEDALLEAALDAGAEDVRNEGEVFEVITTPTAFHKVKEALAAAKIPVEAAEITNMPNSTIPVERRGGPEAAEADRCAGRQRRRADRQPQRGDSRVGRGVSCPAAATA